MPLASGVCAPFCHPLAYCAGLIYAALAAWGIYQVIPRFYENRPINEAIGFLFIINAICNICWILAWQYEQLALSIAFMSIIWSSLAIIYYRLSKKFNPSQTWAQWLLIDFGFSLYFAWINIATLANVFAYATTADERYITAGIAGLIVGFLVEGGIALARLDPVVSAVGAWAIGAISVKNERRDAPSIEQTAFWFAVILAAETVVIMAWNGWQLYSQRRRPWTDRIRDTA